MGMTIDEAIKQLDKYTIPCGRYKEAYDFAIETMKKYQKIQEIMAKRPKDMISSNPTLRAISEVLKDGNDD